MASLPSITGTAVDLLFRAAHLARSEKQNAMLLVPWLFLQRKAAYNTAGDTSQFIPSRDADVAKF
ncbi:hypothetical protein EJD97_013757 [Solanum chilense]|uniref:Uncharacterized protein n=1 Tax=Solanum chilense TaxID=4083 RepID=A0A6N2BFN3_SOLCI|nr:hypothetical protein EJD97_013757 [Solanum chilense]